MKYQKARSPFTHRRGWAKSLHCVFQLSGHTVQRPLLGVTLEALPSLEQAPLTNDICCCMASVPEAGVAEGCWEGCLSPVTSDDYRLTPADHGTPLSSLWAFPWRVGRGLGWEWPLQVTGCLQRKGRSWSSCSWLLSPQQWYNAKWSGYLAFGWVRKPLEGRSTTEASSETEYSMASPSILSPLYLLTSLVKDSYKLQCSRNRLSSLSS